MIEIRQYQENDRSEILRICLGTSKMEELFKQAIAEVFCLYYLECEKENCFVAVDDGNIAGYILCSSDFNGYENYLSKLTNPVSLAMGEGTLNGLRKFTKEYEAHFHIDLDEKYQHQGIGTKLIKHLEKTLTEKNIHGLLLNVSNDNANAISFYKKNNFEVLETSKMETAMGKILNKNITNPYLKEGIYIPDGEPHVFDGRLYIFGSHDEANATKFCVNDYEFYNASVKDLSRFESNGISYKKADDPHNKNGLHQLWAPDVCKGTDGRYYLYYCMNFMPEIGIAVSENPSGPYHFYDYVKDENGNIYNKDLPFDPAVYMEDEDHIYLYTGWGAIPLPEVVTADMMMAYQGIDKNKLSKEEIEEYERQAFILKNTSRYASCLRLGKDMKTCLKADNIIPTVNVEADDFKGHEFFEASSMRKINNKYYFIYSSYVNHELCYAISDYPDRKFKYGGVIISNADLGYKGNDRAKNNYTNNHGSIEKINDNYYIFYHKSTNLNEFSRQGCAERIEILKDGSISQVEMTSCGLNNGPLAANNRYSAYIACNLTGAEGCDKFDKKSKEKEPYITQEGERQYIANMTKNCKAVVKYIRFYDEKILSLSLRGKGIMEIYANEKLIGTAIVNSDVWHDVSIPVKTEKGIYAVTFCLKDSIGPVDFMDFEFSKGGM